MRLRASISKRPYFFLLLSLLSLFCMRVAGQFLVAAFQVPFLPPMQEWYSELIPYPILLLCQIGIIFLFGRVCYDFAGLGGGFSVPSQKLAQRLTKFGIVYLSVMMTRYAFLLYMHPHEFLMRGCIPTFFHCVLASFLLVLAEYHHRASAAEAVCSQLASSNHSLLSQSGEGSHGHA